ncbi:unnamed protein product [Closterium sp. NIES-54]
MAIRSSIRRLAQSAAAASAANSGRSGAATVLAASAASVAAIAAVDSRVARSDDSADPADRQNLASVASSGSFWGNMLGIRGGAGGAGGGGGEPSADHPPAPGSAPGGLPPGGSGASAGAGSTAAGEGSQRQRNDNPNPRTTAAGFDPEALERGAKALREINKSASAKQVFEIMRKQEDVRLAEEKARIAELEVHRQQQETARQKLMYEEQQKLVAQQAQTKAQLARYEDELARKRMQAEHEAQRARNAELVKMQEESGVRQEQIRRATEEEIQQQKRQTELEMAAIERETLKQKALAEAEAWLSAAETAVTANSLTPCPSLLLPIALIQQQKRQTELEMAAIERETLKQKALAEAEARAHEARLSEDVNRRLLLEKSKAETEKWISAINTTFGHIGGGIRALLTDQNKMVVTVAGVTALAAGIYTTREGARVVWHYIDRLLGQPSLVRESSRGPYPWSRSLRRLSSALAAPFSRVPAATPGTAAAGESTHKGKRGVSHMSRGPCPWSRGLRILSSARAAPFSRVPAATPGTAAAGERLSSALAAPFSRVPAATPGTAAAGESSSALRARGSLQQSFRGPCPWSWGLRRLSSALAAPFSALHHRIHQLAAAAANTKWHGVSRAPAHCSHLPCPFFYFSPLISSPLPTGAVTAEAAAAGAGGAAASALMKSGRGFGDVILHPSLHHRIRQLAAATANTKRHGAPFRNMLFFGPPGTGKTMAAKELARQSGLDYALMTGGDVAPLGPQAVTKIHQMFDWAAHTKRGLLLFIDEADAFLCERNKITMSEAQRSALNAMLFRTGDQSRDIVLVLATNRPEDLDSAVTDRIDEMMEFPLPREEERFRLLQLYLHRYVTNSQDGRKWWKRGGGGIAVAFRKQEKIEVKGISEDVLRDAARKMEGFSGREIAKFMASVRGAVYGSKESVLDAQLFQDVVDYKVAEHRQRRDLVAGKGWEAPGEEGGVAGEKKAE